eukprot:TRINITY_DN2424_c0_g2_i3.p2 TRINITY_DN2424_c0_g2~~TRINITY_DN2424_c0_g2_i3.p2  ORF type:complete len:158 (-),score=29.11 TRINITY_DN2424_c0_g2_i3:413-886(-)
MRLFNIIQMAKEFTEKLLNTTYETLDSDKDGNVTYDDFVNYMNTPAFPEGAINHMKDLLFSKRPTVSKGKKDKLMCVFGSFIYADKDKDKLISYPEVKDYITEFFTIGGYPVPSEEEMKETFQKEDENHDGYLDFREFLDFYTCNDKLTELAEKYYP